MKYTLSNSNINIFKHVKIKYIKIYKYRILSSSLIIIIIRNIFKLYFPKLKTPHLHHVFYSDQTS